MKAIITVILACAAMAAQANGSPPPVEPPKANPPKKGFQPIKVGSKSAAAALSGSKSASDASAEQSLNNQNDLSTGGIFDHSYANSDYSSWALFVPPPVFTPPMPKPEVPQGCPAPTEKQSAFSVGSGIIFSEAESLRDNDPCTAMMMSVMYWNRCQYKKADRMLNVGSRLFAKRAGIDWAADPDPALTDYTPENCALLTTPVRPSAPPNMPPVTTPTPPAEACKPPPAPPKRTGPPKGTPKRDTPPKGPKCVLVK